MGSVIGFLIAKGLSERMARIAAYAGLILVIASAFTLAIHLIRKDAVSDHQTKVEQRARPANDKAANERAKDAIDNAKSEQEMKDAIQAQPDQPIAPTTRSLSCERLRRRGNPPAECRP